ncbi:NAD(P)H-dependent oxidoreductase [Cellulosimicrobium marinum]|uniref:NAD(P)H-dependent oxidoreductase n=1 Tax=Cellulosimicrobium marinum TaxID=1638992 RepID=UPI001E54E49E|nr:NAD(P)-dependent oxidoreductase [Cellulosimicrobium marinum]MCB7137034.1 NAD(P)-dependent oxidoreductase [Cellulosimicrobium marinum]
MTITTDLLVAGREREGRPVRVGVLGPGFMGKALILQIMGTAPGMVVTAVHCRDVDKARAALEWAGVHDVDVVGSAAEVDRTARAGRVALTQDVEAVTAADEVDVVVDVTGAVEFGAVAALSAFAHGKHLVLMNAELDATVGWELACRAAEAGVVYTGCDGDQPGVQMNLYRFVRRIGLTPLVCGNVKGLQDRFRNPTTQQGFAQRWGQDPRMVSSFADGTKVNVEQALVANATGMSVHRRGLLGRDHDGHIDELTTMYDVDELRALGGAVDYVVGARPGPGVYVLGAMDDPRQQHYLELYKLGTGPLYSFYTPYHLCHFEVPDTIARAVLLGETTLHPAGPPTVDVVTVAKTDLAPGTVLDDLGGYHYFGECERADVTARDGLLPVGLAHGCTVVRPVARDQVVTYADVTVPPGRVADALRAAQADRHALPTPV